MKISLIFAIMASIIFLGCSNNRKANSQTTDNNQSSDTLNKKNNSVKDDNSITNKYWKLITLEGEKVTMAKNQEREAYFTLKTEQQTVTGFAGCNTFSGNYTLKEGFRIHFSNMASTLKSCPDVNVNEPEYMKVFELANNYSIHGDTLSLNVGRRAPLAVFEAVYF